MRRVRNEAFFEKKLSANQDVVGRFLYSLKIKKHTVKKAMIATYDEIITR